MPLLVIGINHRTAPVEIREKVVFAGDELPEALQELSSVAGVRESLIVSTCNRTELYCFSEGEEQPLVAWLSGWHDLTAHNLDISGSLYRLQRHAGNPARLLASRAAWTRWCSASRRSSASSRPRIARRRISGSPART